MISTDFAPNERIDDALLSLSLIFQPWRWQIGPETEKVKEEIKKLFSQNTKYLILNTYFFLSGRCALYHLIKSLNLPKNSRVIVQAFTCEAVVLPIIANGFKPIYVDIEKETLSMDINNLKTKMDVGTERALSQRGIIIIQHTFGMTPKYRNDILKLAKENSLIVVEDLAHGFDPKIFESNSSISQSPNIYFLLSFGRSKPFSSVFGGAIGSFNKDLNFKLIQPSYSHIFSLLLYKPIAYFIKSTYNIFIGQLIHKILNIFNLLSKEISEKEKKGRYDSLFDKAYPNALAILLLHQLRKSESIQQERINIINYYNKNISISQFPFSKPIPFLRYPILIDNRDLLVELARRQGIFLGLWYNQVVAPKALNLKKVYYNKGDCPVAEEICNRIVNLPTLINEKEARQIVYLLNSML